MTSLDDGADQARDAHTIRAAVDRHLGAIGSGDRRLHGVRIFGSEVEDLANLDTAGVNLVFGRYFTLEPGFVVNVVGRGIDGRPLLDDGVEIGLVVDLFPRHLKLQDVAVAIDRGFAGLREHDEFMAEIGAHRDRLQSHASERAQVGDEHLVVRASCRSLIEVE